MTSAVRRLFLALSVIFVLFTPAFAATTWDTNTSNCNVLFTLSGGNLTATATTATWISCRATTSHNTGKWFFRITTANAQTQFLSGLENSSADINNFPGSTGSTGVGCQGDSLTPLWFAGGGDSACGTGLTGTAVWEVAVDITNGKVWGRVPAQSSQWNKSASSNPATGVGGATFTISGGLFPACGAHATNVACTLDPSGGTPPSGFTVWDGTPVTTHCGIGALLGVGC